MELQQFTHMRVHTAWHATYRYVVFALLSFLLSSAFAQELPSYELIFKNGRITPARLEVPAGVRFKLILKNEGDDPIEYESYDLAVEKVLAPGATSFIVLNSLPPGTYNFYDEFHPENSEMLLIAK